MEQLRFSAAEASRACGLLSAPSPSALDGSSTVLQSAIRSLEALQSGLPLLATDPECLAEAWRLQRTVRRAAALLNQADRYHREWRNLVGVMSAGYGPGGLPGESPPPGRISLRG